MNKNKITKVDKFFKGLTRIANGDYVFNGDLIVEGGLEIDLDDRLVVTGGIKAGDGIEAGCGIKAGCGIEAGDGIEAGCGIEAGSYIDSKKRIFAGISVYHTSSDCIKTIKCKELRNGEICYGELIIEPTKTCEDCAHKVVCTHKGVCEHFMEDNANA